MWVLCDFKFYFLKLSYSKIYSLEGRCTVLWKGRCIISPWNHQWEDTKKSHYPKINSTNNSSKLTLANNGTMTMKSSKHNSPPAIKIKCQKQNTSPQLPNCGTSLTPNCFCWSAATFTFLHYKIWDACCFLPQCFRGFLDSSKEW